MGLSDLGITLWFIWASFHFKSVFLGIVAGLFMAIIVIANVSAWRAYKKAKQLSPMDVAKGLGVENPSKDDPRYPEYIR